MDIEVDPHIWLLEKQTIKKRKKEKENKKNLNSTISERPSLMDVETQSFGNVPLIEA